MKQRIFNLIRIFFGFVGIFALQKPLFMLYHFPLYRDSSFGEWANVVFKGLPLDLSMAGYLTVIPGLLTLLSVWMEGKRYKQILNLYFIVVNLLIALVFVSDLELYTYWGFRMDSTPLFYLASPANAMASVPAMMLLLVPGMMFLTWWVLNRWMRRTIAPMREKDPRIKRRILSSFGLLLLTGLLFIPIRGGFTVSTMNIGKVYHSSNMLLNHAAINPMFSLMSSLAKENDFGNQYRFMKEEEASALFSGLGDLADSTPADTLLAAERPNVVLIVLESFSGAVIEDLGGAPGVVPTMNRLYKEGVAFTNFYANSFRTDRGLVSILSAYPAQPTTSIMKYPSKTQSLPSISGSLKKEGYDLEFIYGGDADFTNMRSYFVSSGFDRIVADQNFPLSDRMSKWGVNDGRMFRYLTEDLAAQQKFPFMKMFLTLSSHEPFDVPMTKFEDPYLNSVAYTDSCLGVFIDELKTSPLWENTLVILLPDHCMRYPYDIANHDPLRYHIPMVWTGGAVRKARVVGNFGSQTDLAATLLGQLRIGHEEFKFSKDMLKRENPEFAFYTFKDGFGILSDSATFVFDCDANREIERVGAAAGILEQQGKAYLQSLYDDLGSR